MATSLTIATGALTTTISTEDDAAAQNLLLNFAYAIGGDEAEPVQELLDKVALELAGYMQRIARERYIERMSAQIRTEAEENVHW